MRPRLQLLEKDLIERIIDEALDVLGTLGMDIQNDSAKTGGNRGRDPDRKERSIKGNSLILHLRQKACGQRRRIPTSKKMFDGLGKTPSSSRSSFPSPELRGNAGLIPPSDRLRPAAQAG